MRAKGMFTAVAVALGLFVTGAVAQHEEHHQDQATAGKPSGMMSGGMMMGQNETGKLVDRLLKSFAAIEAEKDPTARGQKLAEHGVLLKELQAKVQAQAHTMDMMQNMMGGKMMSDSKTMDGDSKK